MQWAAVGRVDFAEDGVIGFVKTSQNVFASDVTRLQSGDGAHAGY